jgi:hypothetical protein
MKTIPLEQLAAYFPYKVKAKFKDLNNSKAIEIGTLGQINDNSTIVCYDTVNAYPDKFKLLLRPLSWLTDEVLSDINCDLLDQIKMCELRDKQISLHSMPYGVVNILLENHVDIFGLIEAGFAEPIK